MRSLLYVPNIKMQDGTHHNVIYVATSTDNVYAFEADNSLNTQPLWHVQLGVPANSTDLNGWNPIFPNVASPALPLSIS